ncbi:MAG TPA: hypothetical protein VGN95_25240 [Pyrinomonadaceae bacterium]|jgi:hypothetical protein|nr:hypothetical protein [Pyrinomonadaceae bacterium]
MSEDRTKDLPTSHTFEQKVLVWLEAIDARLQVLENKKYETKPIWERALKEIAETRIEMNERFDDLDKRMEVLAGDVIKVRARIRSDRDPPYPPETDSSFEDLFPKKKHE